MSNKSAFRFRSTPVALLLSALFVSCSLIAQQQGISGLVTDNTGAVVPNAKVRITNEATGVALDIVTNQAGNYSAPSLVVGRYTVEISAPGLLFIARPASPLTSTATPSGCQPAIELHATNGRSAGEHSARSSRKMPRSARSSTEPGGSTSSTAAISLR